MRNGSGNSRAFDNGKPVVGIDIDGTMGDYHRHFLRFAQEWIGRPMPDPSDINPGLALHQFMGVSKGTYRQCKLAYRQGGLKRSMPVYEGARQLSVRIRRAGAEAWICTTRPYLRLDNIDPDTRHWLKRRARVQFDAVLWGEHKYRNLVNTVGADRVVAVLEDLPSLASQARSVGIKTYLRDQPYNRGVKDIHPTDTEPGLIRVTSLAAAEHLILEDIARWKAKHR